MIFEFRALLMGRQRYGVSVSLFVDCQDKSSGHHHGELIRLGPPWTKQFVSVTTLCRPSRKKYFRNGRGFSLHLTHSRICAEVLAPELE
jgi:hypothetical protein